MGSVILHLTALLSHFSYINGDGTSDKVFLILKTYVMNSSLRSPRVHYEIIVPYRHHLSLIVILAVILKGEVNKYRYNTISQCTSIKRNCTYL